jgi:hypothetical protein
LIIGVGYDNIQTVSTIQVSQFDIERCVAAESGSRFAAEVRA